MMERSSTFISLSGLSGVGAGLSATLGCAATFYILGQHGIDYFDGKPNYYSAKVLRELAVVASLTFLCAVVFAAFYTARKSQRLGLPLWSTTTQQLMVSMGIPVLTGGVLSLILLYHDLFYLVSPCMLIFYGLGLVSAARHTHRELFYLGLCEVVLGLFAAFMVGYGLLFWGIGFGILHIVYGWYMHIKYR
jgi:hypothetical protein